MKPFREHVAVAIDGGGIRGVMVARALALVEEYLGCSAHDIFRLVAGTSTGSILSTGIAAGLTGGQMYALYCELGEVVFRKSWRTALWPLSKYRYPQEPLKTALWRQFGDEPLARFWHTDPPTDFVITAFDLVAQRTRFIKPWKHEYAGWPVVQAVLASCAVPAVFPAVAGRYVDGGVGSYTNPCYLAAYEAYYYLGWDPAETTLISLGTGRSPASLRPGDANRLWPWQWLSPMLGAFAQSADEQQVHLTHTFFHQLDFRRFQVDLCAPIAMDDPRSIPLLAAYGEELAHKIINDEAEPEPGYLVVPA